MLRKISFSLLSVAILIIGISAFNKLGYWDKSVRIFSFRSDSSFAGRNGGGQGGRSERGRFIGQEGRGERFGRSEMRNIPDSLRQRFQQGGRERMNQGNFSGGIRNVEGRGRSDFNGGKKVSLRNVLWFLAVFASFTVATLYIDRWISLLRKRKAVLLLFQNALQIYQSFFEVFSQHSFKNRRE